jgi:predicted  nucleic acid-binding Zn-ribbon protein
MGNLSENFEFERVRATAEAAKISADRSNRGVWALETSVKRHGHYAAGSVIVVTLLSMVVVGGAWWVNHRLQAQGSSLTEILGLQAAVETLNRRMSAAEVAVSTFPEELKNVTGRVDALDKKGTTVRMGANAKPVQESQIAQLNDQIASLEAQHSADTTQIDSLRGEVALLKQDTNSQIANVRSQIPADASQDVAALRSAVDRDQARLALLSRRMDRDRNDFEVSEGQAREVVPGILMTIKETDVGKQQVSGWLYLQHEHRFVYLKNQGLMRPITVYGGSEKEVHDIVITRVRKSYAIGYVLSPKEDGKAALSATAGN